jgi:hypothetical protein
MEDFLIWIFWIIVIVFSLINASLKAKKKKEDAEKATRRAQQSYESHPFPMPEDEMYESDGRYTRKSFGEILEELANPQPHQQRRRPVSTPEPSVEGRDYTVNPQEFVYKEGRGAKREAVYAEGKTSHREVVYEEGGRVTKDTAMPAKSKDLKEAAGGQENIADTKDTRDGENGLIKEILGGEFDLRRAIVESEIITPKYF